MNDGLPLGTPTLHAPAPLHSPRWFRVAQARPRLDVRGGLRRQTVRGERWHTLVSPDGRRSLRVNEAAWSFVGRFDGRTTLQRCWELSLRASADAAPTQDEALDLMARLHAAGLLSLDRPFEPDVAAPAATGRDEHDTTGWMAWRWPLGRPDALLARVAARLGFLLGWRGMWPSIGLLAIGLVLALLLNGPALHADVTSLMASPRALAWLLVVYPAMKLLHEAAHGVVARWHGVPVPQWGLAWLMFVPVPYVDVSAASALPRARERAGVALAGMVAECVCAAVALVAWASLQPGAARDAALVVMGVGLLSSVAVNANPLLRFDGYHLLCDLAGLPNLAARSQRWWMEHTQQRLLGLAPTTALQSAPGERPWLWAYAPAALAMRVTVAAAVTVWLAGVSFWLGLAAAGLMSWSLIVLPLWHQAIAWRRVLHGVPATRRADRRLAATGAAVVVLVAALPLPDVTVAPGVWWLPEPALVRTQVDGFVGTVHVRDGQPVQAGELLLTLHDPAREAEQARHRARLAGLQAEHWQALGSDPARAAQLELELMAAQAELARSDEDERHRQVRAQVAGRIALAGADDLPQRWLPRGTLVAHVVTGEPGLVKVAIPHEQAAHVATAAEAVSVWRAVPGAAALLGQWDRQLSGGGALLPSAALSQTHGGPFETDPADARHLQPQQAVVIAQVTLAAAAAGEPPVVAERLGERLAVRFDHGHAPLALQWLRHAQQAWLHHFHPARG